MKKKLICLISMLLLGINIYSKDKIKVVAPDGLPALSLVKMINEKPQIDGVDVEYKIEKLSESLVMTLMKKDADIAIVPSNLAGQLYNKGLGYKIGGTVGWGSFYVISRENFNSLKDLKGKEIGTIGKGLTPDIILQTLLKKNGLDLSKDIKIDYLSSGNELAPLYLSGKKDIVVIAEPMASKILAKDKNSKINVELNQEWKNLFNVAKGYPQSTLIVSENILKENPNFLDEFINDLKDSIEFIESNDNKRLEYISKAQITLPKDIIDEAIKKANFDFTTGAEGKDEYMIYFREIAENNKKAIGGKIPDEEIFISK